MECKCISKLVVNSGGYPIHEFQEGKYYQYQLVKHEEGVLFYSVFDGHNVSYPMLTDHFKRYFNTIQQIREDKLNQLLNQ